MSFFDLIVGDGGDKVVIPALLKSNLPKNSAMVYSYGRMNDCKQMNLNVEIVVFLGILPCASKSSLFMLLMFS